MSVDYTRYDAPIVVDNRHWRQEVPDYDRYFDGVIAELSQLPREDNLVVDPTLVEIASCGVCGADDPAQFLINHGFAYVRCRRCTHVYLKNRLKEDQIIENYRTSDLDGIAHKIAEHQNLRDYTAKLYEKYTNLLADLKITEGKLLDVGCGAGNFVEFCSNHRSYETYALELNEEVHERLRGIVGEKRLFTERIEDADFGSLQFDVITMWGVLEHLVNPRPVLERAASLLKDGGRMLTLIPNLNSRAFKILGAKVPTLNPRVHLQMYSQESFQHLCSQSGIIVEHLFCELPVIDLMHDYITFNPQLIDDIVETKESYYYVYLLRKK